MALQIFISRSGSWDHNSPAPLHWPPVQPPQCRHHENMKYYQRRRKQKLVFALIMLFLVWNDGMLANVVGFPGIVDTRPKWIIPLNRRSMTCLMRSLGPIDVPPVVRNKCCSQHGMVGIVYLTPSVAGKWIWRLQVQDFVTCAQQRHNRFMLDLDLYARRHHSVVTIKQSATQLTSVRPINANILISPITSIFCNTRSPGHTSEPGCLTFSPLKTCASVFT